MSEGARSFSMTAESLGHETTSRLELPRNAVKHCGLEPRNKSTSSQYQPGW
jgi:hypothetical protein